MNLICTGGKASRLGSLAPHGCKSLTMFNGRPIIEWQLDILGSATIICRPEHQELLERFGPCVTGVWGGVGVAVADACHQIEEGPVTIVYGDTLFNELPEGSDWIGVAPAPSARNWDVVYPNGTVVYEHAEHARVCVGLYSFSDLQRLRRTLDVLTGTYLMREWGMAPVINQYRTLRFIDIPTWADVGDPVALSQASSRHPSTIGTRTVLGGGEMFTGRSM